MFFHVFCVLMQWLPYNSWQVIYIIWRWILLCYFCTWFVVSYIKFNETSHIVSTSLEYMTWVLYLVVSASACTVKFAIHIYPGFRGNDSVNTDVEGAKRNYMEDLSTAADFDNVDIYADWRINNLAWYQKIQWILYSIIIPVEIGISVNYGFELYNPFGNNSNSGLHFNTHCAPAVVAIVDMWLSGITHNVYHIYMIYLFGEVYDRYCAIGGVDPFGNTYDYSILLRSLIPFYVLYIISLPRRWLSNKIHQSCYKNSSFVSKNI